MTSTEAQEETFIIPDNVKVSLTKAISNLGGSPTQQTRLTYFLLQLRISDISDLQFYAACYEDVVKDIASEEFKYGDLYYTLTDLERAKLASFFCWVNSRSMLTWRVLESITPVSYTHLTLPTIYSV